jgi:hypothetical protein
MPVASMTIKPSTEKFTRPERANATRQSAPAGVLLPRVQQSWRQAATRTHHQANQMQRKESVVEDHGAPLEQALPGQNRVRHKPNDAFARRGWPG